MESRVTKPEPRMRRALKACDTCRRLKTRCLPAQGKTSCIRCDSLSLQCSFLSSPEIVPNGGGSSEKIDDIHRGVMEILKHLKQTGSLPSTSGPISRNASPHTLIQTSAEKDFTPYLTSPFTTLMQLVSNETLPVPIKKLHSQDLTNKKPNMIDIISMGMLTRQECIRLVNNFRTWYGDWVSFPPSITDEKLIDNIRNKNCSILLTVMCVLALRCTPGDLKSRCYQPLLRKLNEEMTLNLSILPQSVEFIQAMVIISIYAVSLSDDIMNIDAWYYSGLALQQFLTQNLTDNLLAGEDFIFNKLGNIFDEDSEFEKLTSYRLWNHLCLVHVSNAVLSGRMCIIDDIRVDLSRRTLALARANNFDGRMVAEISIQVIVYNFMQKATTADDIVLAAVRTEFAEWLAEWGYLFDQVVIQFVEFAYHYGYAMVLYTWNYRRYKRNTSSRVADLFSNNTFDPALNFIGNYLNQSVSVDEIFNTINSDHLREIQFHLKKTLEGILRSTPEDLKYLSDHLLFCSMHSALLLIITTRKLFTNEEIVTLQNIKMLSNRFKNIQDSPKDMAYQFNEILETNLVKFFPEINLSDINIG